MEVAGSGLEQPRGDSWATCLVTEAPATGVTTEDGEAGVEDITEAGEDGAEVTIEAGEVEVEHQLDFLEDPRPLVEPGQPRDLEERGEDSLDFCKVHRCDISVFIYKKIQLRLTKFTYIIAASTASWKS